MTIPKEVVKLVNDLSDLFDERKMVTIELALVNAYNNGRLYELNKQIQALAEDKKREEGVIDYE